MLFLDIECYSNYFLISFLRQQGIPVRNRPPKSKLQVLTKHRDASKVRIPKTQFTIPHRMMTIGMRQQQCRA